MVLLLLACTPSAVPVDTDTPDVPEPTADTASPEDTAPIPTADTGDPHPLTGWDTGMPADCSFVEVESGPFASDAPAWDVEIVRPEGEHRFGSVAARYTADGRRLSETDLQTEGGIVTDWTYVPGTWRVATRDTSGIFAPTSEQWSWNGDLATVVQTGVTGETLTTFRSFRPDGLPISTTFDSQIVDTWQYLGPDTWQLDQQTDSQGGWDWTWDCLTGTAVRTDGTAARRRRFYPDGRVRFEASDFEQDGVDDRNRTVRYLGDSWRVDYEILDMDGDGPEAPFVVDWVWTAL